NERIAEKIAEQNWRAAQGVERAAKEDGRAVKQIAAQATQQAIEKTADALCEKWVITRDYVIEQLKNNLELAKSGEKLDLSAANRAAELLGKKIGMLVERAENLNTV